MSCFKKNFVIIMLQLLFVSLSVAQSDDLSLKQLCENSNSAIVAETKSFYSYQSFDKKRVYTDIIIEVKSSLKGNLAPSKEIKLTYFGGTINGITTAVIGYPTFTKGQVSIFFLTEKLEFSSDNYFYRIIGDSQGKFNVILDNDKGEKKIKRDQIGTPLKLNEVGDFIYFENTDYNSFISLIEDLIKNIHAGGAK